MGWQGCNENVFNRTKIPAFESSSLDEFINLVNFQELNDLKKHLDYNLKVGFEGIMLKKTYSQY